MNAARIAARIAARLARAVENLDDVVRWIEADDQSISEVHNVSADLFELRLEIERETLVAVTA